VTDLLQEFKRSLEGLKPSTLRVYVAGAKAAMESAMANVPECGSTGELLDLIREARPEKGVRVAPFLRFLQGGGGLAANRSIAAEDVRGIQYLVVQRLAKRMREVKNPSLASRRDMALIAALCVAPHRGNLRKWPQSCVKITGADVFVWDKRVEEPAFALALRFWYTWRDRLTRPDQRRLYRKATEWSNSGLLFPGPHGEPLSRAALHNAIRRLVCGVGEGSGLTPNKIRAAFLCTDPLSAGRGLR
jgi:hypothetical protein